MTNMSWDRVVNGFCQITDKLTDDEIENKLIIIREYEVYLMCNYINYMVKSGFISYYNTDARTFRINKRLPKDLSLKELKELCKSNPNKMNIGKKPGTKWDRFIKIINTKENDIFNIYIVSCEMNKTSWSNYGTIRGYLRTLCVLGYVEMIYDKKKYFKLIKKIPDNLTSILASKMAYDKFYKRSVKIKNIREKMNNNG